MADESDPGLGARFYLRLAGFLVIAGIIGFALTILGLKALFAWGIVGFLVFIALFAYVGTWIANRRRERES